jgi:hypothetical protein
MVRPFICAPDAVFDVYRHPSYAGKKYKACKPVEKRYLGNCNVFRYKKSSGPARAYRGSNGRFHDATPVVRPADELQTTSHIT